MAEAKEREVEKVKMEDGREVEFAGKRKMLKKVLVEDGVPSVRFDYRNGMTKLYIVPDQHRAYSAGHGLAQKLGDETAGMKNEDGSPASEDDMFLAVDELYDRLAASQDWNAVSEGGGFGGMSVLMKALVEWSGQTAEQVKEFLKGKNQTEKLALRDNATKPGKSGLTIKQIVEKLEAEKKAKAKTVDTDKLLDGLPAIA